MYKIYTLCKNKIYIYINKTRPRWWDFSKCKKMLETDYAAGDDPSILLFWRPDKYEVVDEKPASIESEKILYAEWSSFEGRPHITADRIRRMAVRLNNKSSVKGDLVDCAHKDLFSRDLLHHYMPELLAQVDLCSSKIIATLSETVVRLIQGSGEMVFAEFKAAGLTHLNTFASHYHFMSVADISKWSLEKLARFNAIIRTPVFDARLTQLGALLQHYCCPFTVSELLEEFEELKEYIRAFYVGTFGRKKKNMSFDKEK